MINQELSLHPKESKGWAAVGGAGSGTLLVVAAGTLPENHFLRPWLLYAAPTVSTVLSVIWLWIQTEIGNYIQNRKFDTLVEKARGAYTEALENPNTSEQHKAVIRQQLEELEKIVSARHLRQIQSLTPFTMSDVQEFTGKIGAEKSKSKSNI